MQISLTVILIAITCAVSFAAFNNRKLYGALIMWPPAVSRRHEWHRLITYGVIHGDFAHLLFNMITLYFFGELIEKFIVERIGGIGYLGFYVGALIVSILPSYLRHRNDSEYASLGASGAVNAVLFAFILFAPWSLIFVFFIPMPAILYAVLYVGYTIWAEHHAQDRTNHTAHLWGAAYGVLFVLMLEPRVLQVFVKQLLNPSF